MCHGSVCQELSQDLAQYDFFFFELCAFMSGLAWWDSAYSQASLMGPR